MQEVEKGEKATGSYCPATQGGVALMAVITSSDKIVNIITLYSYFFIVSAESDAASWKIRVVAWVAPPIR